MDFLGRLLIDLLYPIVAKPVLAYQRSCSEWWRRIRSDGWPIVHGRLHASAIYAEQNLWLAEVSYSYTVNGEYYSGYSKMHFANEDDAEAYANRFLKDMTLFIRHKPHKPEASLIRSDDQMGMGAYVELSDNPGKSQLT